MGWLQRMVQWKEKRDQGALESLGKKERKKEINK
jgi:hypothetical protein